MAIDDIFYFYFSTKKCSKFCVSEPYEFEINNAYCPSYNCLLN